MLFEHLIPNALDRERWQSGQREALVGGWEPVTPEFRRLLGFLSAMILAQGVLLTIMAPLLPSLGQEFGLSKAQAGVLIGAFPFGQGCAALPVAMLAPRVGLRLFVVAGLVGFAGLTVVFGYAGSPETMILARFAQGVACGLGFAAGFAWLVEAAPRERRAQFIALLTGASSTGSMLGPVVGAVAVDVGRAPVSLVIAGVGGVLAWLGRLLPAPTLSMDATRPSVLRAAFRPSTLVALWFIALPAMLVGAVLALAPLRLGELGVGSVGIAVTFVAAAGVGIVARPIVGGWADRRGMLAVICRLLLVAAPLTVLIPLIDNVPLLSLVLVCAVACYGVVYGPAMALSANAFERAGLAQVVGFGMIAVTFGCFGFVGSAAGGLIASATSDKVVYAALAALSVASAPLASSAFGRNIAHGRSVADKPAR